MILDVAALPEGTTTRDIEATPDELHLALDTCRISEAVKIRLVTHRSEDEVVAEGVVSTKATATCVRCLTEFVIPVEEQFRVILRMVPDAEITPDSGDDDFCLVPKSEPAWKSGDLFRELVILAVPLNPLCDNDCAGLCAGCGRNLNTEKCICERDSSDGHFEGLKGLLEKGSKRV